LRFDASVADIITGALELLTKEFEWEQNTPTDLTPAQAAELMASMLQEYLTGGDGCMIGAIVAYATVLPPDGTLACDGTTYLRVDYPTLYALLDGYYKTDADHFIMPDLRGRVIVGVGQGVGLTNRVIGEIGGEEKHQLSEAELASHVHTQNNTPGSIVIPVGPPSAFFADTQPGLPAWTGSTGGDQSHENMQPYHALRYAMVAR